MAHSGMSSSYHLLLWCWTLGAVRPGEQCSPIELLSTKLKHAEKRTTDGRLTLNMVKPETGTSTIPSCSGQNMSATLIRSQLGQTVTFHCTVPECATNPATCADTIDGLRWVHRRYSVWHLLNNKSNQTSPFNYSMSTNTTMAHLLVHNITIGAAGPVQCLRKGILPDGHYCVVALYDMKPFLTTADLFTLGTQQVTARAGQNVTLRCDLQFALNSCAYRYIWRYNGHIVMAPGFHPLSGLIKSILPYESHYEYNETYTTLTLRDAPKSLNGRYECWVLPYFEVDEWIVNIIHLQLV